MKIKIRLDLTDFSFSERTVCDLFHRSALIPCKTLKCHFAEFFFTK